MEECGDVWRLSDAVPKHDWHASYDGCQEKDGTMMNNEHALCHQTQPEDGDGTAAATRFQWHFTSISILQMRIHDKAGKVLPATMETSHQWNCILTNYMDSQLYNVDN